jgi:hypothetical protein
MTETFTIVPASSKVLLVVVPVTFACLAALLLSGYITYSSRHVRFEVDKQALHIRGDMYGRDIDLSNLRIADAKLVNLNEAVELQPRMRTNGAGLPGYSSGWFRLRDGEKALLFVTERTRVVYIPTSEGYSLLLSVSDADRFLASFKQHGHP